MNKHVDKAILMMNAAKPSSGIRPQTEAEWIKLQRATEEMSYAMHRSMGMSDKAARDLASLLGGGAGRMLLDLVYQDDSSELDSKKPKS